MVQNIPDVLTNSKQDPSQLISVKVVSESGNETHEDRFFFNEFMDIEQNLLHSGALKRGGSVFIENCQNTGERGFQDLLMVQTFYVIGPVNTNVTSSYPNLSKII